MQKRKTKQVWWKGNVSAPDALRDWGEVPADTTDPGACGKGQRLKRYVTDCVRAPDYHNRAAATIIEIR